MVRTSEPGNQSSGAMPRALRTNGPAGNRGRTELPLPPARRAVRAPRPRRQAAQCVDRLSARSRPRCRTRVIGYSVAWDICLHHLMLRIRFGECRVGRDDGDADRQRRGRAWALQIQLEWRDGPTVGTGHSEGAGLPSLRVDRVDGERSSWRPDEPDLLVTAPPRRAARAATWQAVLDDFECPAVGLMIPPWCRGQPADHRDGGCGGCGQT
jgi:hypothetical protein